MAYPQWPPQYGPPPPARRPGWYVFAGIAAVVAAATAVAIAVAVAPREQHADYQVSDCVSVSADGSGELRATHTSCSADLSYTVGALANEDGDCVPDRYDQFRSPFADPATERLCLVPNLVVGHCYRIGIPMGKLDPVDCSRSRPAVFRVTKRLDVSDLDACPDEKSQFAMAYPSPARTYCAEMPT